jgi:hypothetical protein
MPGSPCWRAPGASAAELGATVDAAAGVLGIEPLSAR